MARWFGLLCVVVLVCFGVAAFRDQVRRIQERLDAMARDHAVMMDQLDKLVARTGQKTEQAGGAPSSPVSSHQPAGSAKGIKPRSLSAAYKVYYRVKQGEDIFQVSQRFGVSEVDLRKWNGLGPSEPPRPGQILVVKRTKTTGRPSQGGRSGMLARASSGEAQQQAGGKGRAATPAGSSGMSARRAAPQAKGRAKGTNKTTLEERMAHQVPARDLQVPAAPGCRSLSGRSEVKVHIVRRGENLFSIAKVYGVSWKDLAKRNHLSDPGYLRVGQLLRIPTRGRPGRRSTSSGFMRHRVRRGESLYRIGLAYGVNWRAIARANGIEDPSHLVPGQVLEIPGPGRVPMP